jgi:dGTPase
MHPHNQQKRLSAKKFHIYASEQPVLAYLVERLGMLPMVSPDIPFYARHPLAFLVEAADDICYNIIDIEDAYKLKLITFDEARMILESVTDQESLQQRPAVHSRLPEGHRSPYPQGRDTYDQWIIHLRAMAIGSLITDAAEVFMANHYAILAGQFDAPLIEQGRFKMEVKAIQQFSQEKLYEHRKKLHLELAGFSYIGTLLDCFVPAAVDFYTEAQALGSLTREDGVACHKRRLNPSTQRLLKLMNFPFKPDEQTQYRHLLDASKYELIQRATDYVSGMTDEFARSMANTLSGKG